MQAIKIVGIPQGIAPEIVREKWVCLVLPLAPDRKPGEQIGPLNGQPENLGGYEVEASVALAILDENAPTAATWYREAAYQTSYKRFVFAKNICELVEA